jgi:hypothetical protein
MLHLSCEFGINRGGSIVERSSLSALATQQPSKRLVLQHASALERHRNHEDFGPDAPNCLSSTSMVVGVVIVSLSLLMMGPLANMVFLRRDYCLPLSNNHVNYEPAYCFQAYTHQSSCVGQLKSSNREG